MAVGGINIQVGVGLKSFAEGIKKGESLLKNFQKKMTDIRLDKAIKGDPFGNTTKYMKEARGTLNKVFDEWSSRIRIAGNNMDKLATKSKQSVQTLITEYQKLSNEVAKKQKLFTTGIFKGGGTPLESLRATLSSGGGGTPSTAIKKDLTDQLRKIQQFAPAYSQARKQIGKAISDINKGFKVNADNLYKYINQAFEEVNKQYASFGKRFKQEFQQQGILNYAEQLKQARSLGRVQKDRNAIVKELTVSEEKLRANIAGGLNVVQSRVALAKDYEKRQQAGIVLTEEQIRLIKEVNAVTKQYQPYVGTSGNRLTSSINRERGLAVAEVNKAEQKYNQIIATGAGIEKARTETARIYQSAQAKGVTLTKEQARLVQEVNATTKQYQSTLSLGQKIRRDTGLAIAETYKQEKRARTERQLGINIEKNSIAVMQALQERQNLGIKLNKDQAIELNALEKWYKKTQVAARGFLSPEWFRERLVWFVQLRLAWGAWRQLGESLRSLIDYQNQLARAMRTARSEMMSQTEIAKSYSQAMVDVRTKHGVTWQQAGEALYQFGSAGLSAEESVAALDSTMKLIVGTEGDVREVTKGIAGLYNNFGNQLTNVTSLSEKFNYINSIIADTWQHHQIEISELIEGYKELSAVGKQSGLTFEQMSALLGVLNDHMIKGSKAGTTLRNVLLHIQQKPFEFGKAFGIDIDMSKPLDFLKIMREISAEAKKGKMTMYDVSTAFEYLGIRGTPAFETILQYMDEVDKDLDNLDTKMKSLNKSEDSLLNTLKGRWNQFKGSLSESLTEIEKPTGFFKNILKDLSNILSSDTSFQVVRKLAEDFDKLYGKDRIDKIRSLTAYEVKALGEQKKILEERKKAIEREGIGGTSTQAYRLTVNALNEINGILTIRNKLNNQIVSQGEKDKVLVTQISEQTKITESDWKNLTSVQKNLLEGQTQSLSTQIHIAKLRQQDAKDAVKYYNDQLNKIKSLSGVDEATETARINARKNIEDADNKLVQANEKLLGLEKKQNTNQLDVINNQIKIYENEKRSLDSLFKKNKNLEQIQPKINALNEKLNSLYIQRNGLLSEQDRYDKKTPKQLKQLVELRKQELELSLKTNTEEDKARVIDTLKAEEELGNENIKTLENKIKELKVGKEDEIQLKKILDYENQISDIRQEQALNQLQTNLYMGMNVKLAQKIFDNTKATVDAEREANKEAYSDALSNLKIQRLRNALQNKLTVLALKEYKVTKAGGDNELELLDISIEKLKLENETLSKSIKLTTDTSKQKKFQDDIRNNLIEINKLEDQRLKITQPLLYVYRQMKQDIPSFRESIADWIKGAVDATSSGLTDFLQNATGGFQEAQQEVENLKGNLVDLEQQKQQLADQGILSEDDANNLKELNQEIADTKNKIEDLQDPLKNTANAFKDFAKGVIDEIRKIINQWIAMQIVMGVVRAVAGGTTNTAGMGQYAGAYSSGSLGFGNALEANALTRGTGGILPKIKSFRSFSSGGITNNPAMAILGDNASRKELVIPSENIQNGSVYGYARDKSEKTTTIINAIGENDIANELAKKRSGEVIVNWVYRTQRNRV